MTFVTLTDPKKSVPLSQVTGVEKIERERLRLTMQDGTHVETHAFLWEHVARYQFQQVIPASPGTFLITETEDEGYAPEYFEPVIGWAVHAAGGVQPLIHYGIPTTTTRTFCTRTARSRTQGAARSSPLKNIWTFWPKPRPSA